MRISVVAVLTLTLALIGTTAMAQEHVTNTWLGMTGLVIVPSAGTAPQREFIASFNWIDTERDSTSVWSAILGIAPRFEAGVASVRRAGSSEVIGNAKYDLNLPRLTGNPRAADLAIGVWDLGDDIDQAWYLVLSDDFEGQSTNARWSIGLADSSGARLDGLFAGMEFAAFERSLIQIDYDGDNLNAALRHGVSDQISVGIGFIDGDLALNAALHTGF